MINLEMSTMIYRPVNQVFDFVSKPENDFQWQVGTLAAARLPKGGSPIGTFFRSIGHLMGRRNLGIFEITEFEPNQKYSFRSLSGPFHLQTSYTFEIDNPGTKLNIAIQANVVDFFQVDEGILGKKMEKQLKENLAMLKHLLEARQILSVPEINSLPSET